MKLIKLKKHAHFYYLSQKIQDKRIFGPYYKNFETLLKRKSKLRALRRQLLSSFFINSNAIDRTFKLTERIWQKINDSIRKMA